jgi:hypothetical protein
MPTVNPTCYHQSASSNNAFMKCPTLFRLTYREGLRLDRDTDSQRQGTNWHAIHEHHANTDGDGDAKLQAVIALLNERYANVPTGFDSQEWALERTILLTCFIGYQWYYTNDPIETLASEVAFNLPLHLPKIGMPLPMDEVQRVGKIDHVIRWQGMVGVQERKSTSRSIAADGDYWDKAKKDTQVSGYAAAFRDMLKAGQFDQLGIAADERFGNTLYDVWHKPTIKPKMLTQAETARFIAEGTYFDQQFEVRELADGGAGIGIDSITVDGEKVEIEPGKKGFAIRESVGMFAARLLADIYERPDFYYVRREIPRTDADVRAYRAKSFAIYQTQKLMEKHGCWFENEQQCRATFPCPMIAICYGPGADAVCDGKTTPPGFKRIFVDLTVKGQEIEE